MGCDEKNSAWSPDGPICPAHRHRPEQPTPQGVEAIAAIERDDRAANSERVPHRLPDSRGNKTLRVVQPGGAGFHTSRTGVSSLPAAHRMPVTRYRKPSRAVAHVTVASRREAQCPVNMVITGPVDLFPAHASCRRVFVAARHGRQSCLASCRTAMQGGRSRRCSRCVTRWTAMLTAVKSSGRAERGIRCVDRSADAA